VLETAWFEFFHFFNLISVNSRRLKI
jgi:hypothetical protein